MTEFFFLGADIEIMAYSFSSNSSVTIGVEFISVFFSLSLYIFLSLALSFLFLTNLTSIIRKPLKVPSPQPLSLSSSPPPPSLLFYLLVHKMTPSFWKLLLIIIIFIRIFHIFGGAFLEIVGVLSVLLVQVGYIFVV